METTTHKSFRDIIINGLKKAITELEEFNVQVSLGKMEAHDAYEAAKKKMHHFLHETEQLLQSDEEVKDLFTEFRATVEELRVQLALGKAETRDAFEAQRKKIATALSKLEAFVETKLAGNKTVAALRVEIVKFLIKLEILRLRIELNRMDVHEEFEAKKRQFAQKLEKIRESVSEMEKQGRETWTHFKDDISEAYTDLRKAFVG